MDYQLTQLFQRIQLLSVNERQPIIKYLDDLDRARPRFGLTSSSQSSSEDRQLNERINYFRSLNKAGPAEKLTDEGRPEYDYLLRKFHGGTISQLELDLLWELDYRFSGSVAKSSIEYRKIMNIPMNANGSRSKATWAKHYYESTPQPQHR